MEPLQAAMSPFGSLVRNFYIADLFDVVVIAVLIYSVLFLFKQTRSLLILIGLGMTVVMYALAQIFNLYLTSLVLQSFFSVFFIVLVVVFQEELRRFFEFIAVFSTRQSTTRQLSANSPSITELLHAIEYLASQKVGALVVIRGRENIDRLVDGGRTLDGVISEDLITSIFDTTSPGHDGAMIINKNRIVQFGTHLPLSTNFKEIGRHGTRHSAALGIVERSDAFAIIVSEEKGTISIAHKGTLKEVHNIEDLDSHLNTFLHVLSSEHAYTTWGNLIRKNSFEKIIAVVIAGLLWFFAVYRADTVQRDFKIPITYKNVPADFIIEETKPNTLTVTIEGRGKAVFERLDEKTLNTTIDGSTITSGINTITVHESDITALGIPFSVITIEPTTISILAKRYTTISLPIHATIAGRPANGFRVTRVDIVPSRVSALIPEDTEAPASVITEPIVIEGLRETMHAQTRLVLSKNIRLEKQENATLAVIIVIDKQ